MRMAVHPDVRGANKRPGLRYIQLLGNAHHVACIYVQHLLDRVFDAFQLRLFKNIEVFGDQVLRVADHLQPLNVGDLGGRDGPGNVRPEKWFDKEREHFVRGYRHGKAFSEEAEISTLKTGHGSRASSGDLDAPSIGQDARIMDSLSRSAARRSRMKW